MIFETKLYRPKLNKNIIPRNRLLLFLEENKDKTATFVVAPTGYGKSILVSQWLETYSKSYCWLSIDHELSVADSFFRYLLYGLSVKFPDVFKRFQHIVLEGELPPEKIILELITNGFNKIKGECILVLDDYHLVSDPQIKRFVEYLCGNPCPRVHVVLIAQKSPALNLNKQMVFGEITELGVADLRLNNDELMAISALNLTTLINPNVAKTILNYTEGWVVGIKMALFYYSKNQNNQGIQQKFSLKNAHFSRYLTQETFALLAHPLQELVLCSAISVTFSLDLLQAIFGGHDSEFRPNKVKKLFDELLASSLFLVPLDEEGRWYRFHHYYHDFLSDLLCKTKTKDEIQQLHNKAALYFEQNKNLDEAIRHGVKANNCKYLVSIFKNYKHDLLNHDQFSRLTKWIDLVPKQWQETEPEILVTRTFLHDSNADYAAMQKDAELLYRILPQNESNHRNTERWRGELQTALASPLFLSGRFDEALAATEEALNKLPEKASYMRDVALFLKLLLLQTNGQFGLAEKEYKNTLAAIPFSDKGKRARLSALKAMLATFLGELDDTIGYAIKCIELLKGSNLFVSAIYAHYFYHTASYLKNDLANANIPVPDIEKYIYLGRPFWGLNFLFTKGLVLNAQGKHEELNRLINQLYEFANNYAEIPLRSVVKAFEAEICLIQQDYKRAKSLSHEANFEPYPPYCFAYFPQLTQIKLWINQASQTSLKKANKKLTELIALGQATNRINLLLSALPLQALTLHLLGDKNNCRTKITEALHLSEPREYIRNFVDLGEPMFLFLSEFSLEKPDITYLNILKAAFENENGTITNTASIKITHRDIEMLQLLAMGMRNKEIAEKLNIETNSVKTSLYRLYKKLGVNRRAAALLKAHELGYLHN